MAAGTSDASMRATGVVLKIKNVTVLMRIASKNYAASSGTVNWVAATWTSVGTATGATAVILVASKGLGTPKRCAVRGASGRSRCFTAQELCCSWCGSYKWCFYDNGDNNDKIPVEKGELGSCSKQTECCWCVCNRSCQGELRCSPVCHVKARRSLFVFLC